MRLYIHEGITYDREKSKMVGKLRRKLCMVGCEHAFKAIQPDDPTMVSINKLSSF